MLEIRGLAPGLVATPSPDTVDVLILGPLPVLDALTPEDVRVVLDLTDFGPGTYQLTPEVVLLSDRLRMRMCCPARLRWSLLAPRPRPRAARRRPRPRPHPLSRLLPPGGGQPYAAATPTPTLFQSHTTPTTPPATSHADQ